MYGQSSFVTTLNASPGIATGTFVERSGIIPSTGNLFVQTDDARDAPAGLYYYVNGFWNYTTMNPEELIYNFDDMLIIGGNAAIASRFLYSITGSATPNGLYNNRSGTVVFSTAASTTGRVTIYRGSINNSSGGYFGTGGAIYYKCSTIDFPTLSVAGEDFRLRIGMGQFGGAGLGGDLDNGAWFEYDRATSVNWLLRTAKNAVRTTADSGIPVATGVLLFEIFINAAGTQIDYYLNNVLIGTVLPVAFTVFMNPMFQIVKSSGVNPRIIVVDYIKDWQRRSSPRTT